ncbi:hypothetical protein I3271_05555 [Photobacterium leiognathi]|uniref:hypothetical protein n=1 Tax=Photobacterium leiognathi TaxID=553611 RepID=UPI001EDE9366|nr:hypothetical protein [Photobacterium leiognathi]MCG3884147.1 hypothetical protein [Photobacterium leiognathi]
MAKIDYALHQAQYIEQSEINPDLSIRQYCEDNGLNYNSARRYIRNPAKGNSVKRGMQKAEIKRTSTVKRGRNWRVIYFDYLNDAIENPSLSVTQFAALNDLPAASVRREFAKLKRDGEFNDHCERLALAQRKHEDEKQKAKANFKLLKSKNKIKSVRRRANTQEQKREQTSIFDQNSAQSRSPERDHLGRFLSGNRFSMVHGGYAQIINLDQDIIDTVVQIDPLNLANEIIAARAHYLNLQRFLALERDAIIERYDDNDPIMGFDGKPVSITKVLGDLEYSAAGKLRAAETSIGALSATAARIQCDVAKILIKDHETAVHDTKTELDIRNSIMIEAEQKEWSALQTAKACEKFGIRVPVTVLEEMKREIATYEPPVDDNGLSDDELDAICLEYEKKQSEYVSHEVPARRERLQKLIDEQNAKENGGIVNQATSEEEQPDHSLDDEADDETFPFDDLDSFDVLGGGE